MSGRILAAAAVLGALLAVGLVLYSAGPPAPKANLSFIVEDMNGVKVDLSTFAGQPLIVNLWATWCGPCKLETPQLVALGNKYRDRGLKIVGLSVDDKPDDIRAFASEFKVNYPMLVGLGQDSLLLAMGYEGQLPLSVLVKPDGTIAGQITGLKTTADWEQRIEGLLK